MKKTILMTGTSGYVGKFLATYLQNEFNVVALLNDQGLPWRLGDSVHVKQMADAHYIIHAAWDMNAEQWTDIIPINIRGSRRLVKQASSLGVPVLFISSMSAFRGCRSKYGRAKLMVEQTVVNKGGRIIRPGLVWSPGELGGMLGKIARVIRWLPLIAIPSTDKQKLHMTNLSNLGDILLDILQGKVNINRHPVYAEPEPITLKAIVEAVASKNQRPTLVCAINPAFFIFALTIANRLLGRKKIKIDSVVGLLYAVEKPDFCGIYPTIRFLVDY
jgi:nucleoside-diphosphate-sugar epimerase